LAQAAGAAQALLVQLLLLASLAQAARELLTVEQHTLVVVEGVLIRVLLALAVLAVVEQGQTPSLIRRRFLEQPTLAAVAAVVMPMQTLLDPAVLVSLYSPTK
jgi:hypothetical protein